MVEKLATAKPTTGRSEAEIARPTLLIVDDETAIREVLRYLFQLRGFAVLEAEDGETAEQLLRTMPVDLVILDLVMPGVSGEEVLQSIRQRPDTKNLPVIILSARPDADKLSAAQLAQVVVYKPFDLLELEALVRRLLAQ